MLEAAYVVDDLLRQEGLFDWYSLASVKCTLPPKPEKAMEIPALPIALASDPSEMPQNLVLKSIYKWVTTKEMSKLRLLLVEI